MVAVGLSFWKMICLTLPVFSSCSKFWLIYQYYTLYQHSTFFHDFLCYLLFLSLITNYSFLQLDHQFRPALSVKLRLLLYGCIQDTNFVGSCDTTEKTRLDTFCHCNWFRPVLWIVSIFVHFSCTQICLQYTLKKTRLDLQKALQII